MSVSHAEKVAAIIRDAGGKIIGRTRLQKIAYLLTAAGLEKGFNFTYKHYGPFSEDVATGSRYGHLLGYFKEEEQEANWGGIYSVYTLIDPIPSDGSQARQQLASLAAETDAIVLELVATAVFLAKEGFTDAWAETERRKPEKCQSGRLEEAKSFLEDLHFLSVVYNVPTPLPSIN